MAELANRGYALTVRGAFKSYNGKHMVIDGLNMSVPEGSIYGLLGPSGCGKSTLLNSIVGLVDLDYGSIETTVISRKELGFMPQKLSLYTSLTIEEIFQYYGKIYDMVDDDINFRIDTFHKLLDLPELSFQIDEISGGEQRRVSLAVAMLHNPRMLILDEPTSGVDPLLRSVIWDYLFNICTGEHKTVIITTHYVEEAASAHTIGLMREGVLLRENSPNQLMLETNNETIEGVFFDLSKFHEDTKAADKICNIEKITAKTGLTKSEIKLSFRLLKIEFVKNCLFLQRSIAVTITFVLLPILAFICLHYGMEDVSDIKLGIINDEILQMNLPSCYQQFTRKCQWKFLSCHYLSRLKLKGVILEEYQTETIAKHAVEKGQIWGFLHFHSNFSKYIYRYSNDQIHIKDEVIRNGMISAYLDRSNFFVDGVVVRALRDSYQEFIEEVFKDCKWNVQSTKYPLQFQNPVYGESTTDRGAFMTNSYMALIIFGITFQYGFIIIIEEKNSGAIGRVLASDVSILEVLGGHIIILIIIQLINIIISVVIVYGIWGFKLTSPFLAIALLISLGISGIAMVVMLSLMFDSMTGAATVGTGVTLGILFLGGSIWPPEGIHPKFWFLSWMAPTTFATISLRHLTEKDWDITYAPIYEGFLSCIIWTTIFITITVIYVGKLKSKVFLSNYN